jgi:hypothetical protein
MKSSDSTEMDRLLRRYARRTGETPLRAEGTGHDASPAANAGSHLDADEMNAYAEGALPEGARSRYFAHLADCDTCRKLVTDLTLAASVSSEGRERVAQLEATPSKSWRDWLRAIFSPPVLRYGVPALALFAAIVVVVVVAMRSQRDAGSVAQYKDDSNFSTKTTAPGSNSATANTTTSGTTAENHSNSNAVTLADQQGQTQPGIMPAPTPAPDAMSEDTAPVVSQETEARPATTMSDTKNKAGESIVAGKREQAEVTAAPPPPAQTAQAPVLSSTPVLDETQNRATRDEPKQSKSTAKEDADKLPVYGRGAAGGVAAKKAEADEERRDVGRASTTARPARSEARKSAPAAPTNGPADVGADRGRAAGTRVVSGRQFQRQGGAWVDTAYNSSRATTNVRRGSEQYRALVADEPGLRSIAEQLGGEVIVVWKSRAYRFY